MNVLDDVLAPGLRVVFCGTAVGRKSAEVNAYYAGPGNAFWSTLHEIGLTPHCLRPSEFRTLTQYGIGLTDVCKVMSGADRDIESTSFDVEGFLRKIDANHPHCVAFNGKRAAEVVLQQPVDYGEHPELVDGSLVYVLPSTSGAARGYWDVVYWRQLAASLRR